MSSGSSVSCSASGNGKLCNPGRGELNDALVLYTDGMVEARNGKEEYGMERLRQKVVELGARPAAEIVQGIISSVSSPAVGRRKTT